MVEESVEDLTEGSRCGIERPLADRTAVTSKCASKVPVSSVSETSEVQVMRSGLLVSLPPAHVLDSLNGSGVPPVGVNVPSIENVTAWYLGHRSSRCGQR
jgi:hypothetical protein